MKPLFFGLVCFMTITLDFTPSQRSKYFFEVLLEVESVSCSWLPAFGIKTKNDF
jgi:hypothetical protein